MVGTHPPNPPFFRRLPLSPFSSPLSAPSRPIQNAPSVPKRRVYVGCGDIGARGAKNGKPGTMGPAESHCPDGNPRKTKCLALQPRIYFYRRSPFRSARFTLSSFISPITKFSAVSEIRVTFGWKSEPNHMEPSRLRRSQFGDTHRANMRHAGIETSPYCQSDRLPFLGCRALVRADCRKRVAA